VPWNNNNAEHAIKAFAKLRDVIAGSASKKGVDEYLTLLTVAETCEYRGIGFLDFLRSRETNIETYARGQRRYPNRRIVDLLERGPWQVSSEVGHDLAASNQSVI
jgi:hypothetical protein